MLNHAASIPACPSDTRSVAIEASRETVFAFVADPRNLPRWAVGFCKAIRQDVGGGERWIATTASGDISIRYATNVELGVVDFYFSPAPGIEVAAFSRVLPNAAGAEYVFTQFQVEGMPAEVFDAQVRALTEELQVLRALIAATLACPI
jgi:hypothetical protein